MVVAEFTLRLPKFSSLVLCRRSSTKSRYAALPGRDRNDSNSGLASPNNTANLSGLFLGCMVPKCLLFFCRSVPFPARGGFLGVGRSQTDQSLCDNYFRSELCNSLTIVMSSYQGNHIFASSETSTEVSTFRRRGRKFWNVYFKR